MNFPTFLGTTKEQCRRICRDDKGLLPFYCKSFHYSEEHELCILSEHDTFDKSTTLNSTHFSYSEATCVQGGTYVKSDGFFGNSDTGTYFQLIFVGDLGPRTELDIMAISQSFDTSVEPFRLLRNTLLEAEPYVVYQDYVLGKCLDECLYRDIER